MSDTLTHGLFSNALTRLTGISPFGQTLEELFFSVVNAEGFEFPFNYEEIEVVDEKYPILSSMLNPTPSNKFLSVVSQSEETVWLMADIHRSLKDGLFFCFVTDVDYYTWVIQHTNPIYLESIYNTTKRQDMFAVINLKSFLTKKESTL